MHLTCPRLGISVNDLQFVHCDVLLVLWGRCACSAHTVWRFGIMAATRNLVWRHVAQPTQFCPGYCLPHSIIVVHVTCICLHRKCMGRDSFHPCFPTRHGRALAHMPPSCFGDLRQGLLGPTCRATWVVQPLLIPTSYPCSFGFVLCTLRFVCPVLPPLGHGFGRTFLIAARPRPKERHWRKMEKREGKSRTTKGRHQATEDETIRKDQLV